MTRPPAESTVAETVLEKKAAGWWVQFETPHGISAIGQITTAKVRGGGVAIVVHDQTMFAYGGSARTPVFIPGRAAIRATGTRVEITWRLKRLGRKFVVKLTPEAPIN
jgi:hypothetical protein